MEVSKKGTVKFPGKLSVSKELSVDQNAVIKGDLIVEGKIRGDIEAIETINNDMYLGDKEKEGSWKISIDTEDGESFLVICKKEEGEWVTKQLLS